MSAGRQLTRDEAMMWLNDRLGQPAAIYVDLYRDDHGRNVISAETGMLQHCRADKRRANPWVTYARRHRRALRRRRRRRRPHRCRLPDLAHAARPARARGERDRRRARQTG